MKYLFIIQGEGRGHLTQALSLKSLLETNGHEVVAVMVGSSAKRRLPAFFDEKINAEVIRYLSPNFMPTPKNKRSPLLVSVLYNAMMLPAYIDSMMKIQNTINRTKPDIVVNFYELLCGITYGLFHPKALMMNIAHQYYFLTSNFEYTGKKKWQFRMLNFYSRLTALNSYKILALSFRRDIWLFENNIVIVPPLLRPEVLKSEPEAGNYIHGYMLNSGYVEDLALWSSNNPKQSLHFFWDKKGVDPVTHFPEKLTLHTLDDTLFLKYMAGSRAYATTGGFESVFEAMYLQKPVLMVPTHIEQECNVMDAMGSGAGISADTFELDKLLDFLPQYKKSESFRQWVLLANESFLTELCYLPELSAGFQLSF